MLANRRPQVVYAQIDGAEGRRHPAGAVFDPDIGILASRDPVAIDQASFDLVNRQMGLSNSLLQKNREPGFDKFQGVWENTLGNIQLDYGAKIGLGSKEYRLIEI